jgi:hypothetical protein
LGLISSRKLLTKKVIITNANRWPGLTAAHTEPMMNVCTMNVCACLRAA